MNEAGSRPVPAWRAGAFIFAIALNASLLSRLGFSYPLVCDPGSLAFSLVCQAAFSGAAVLLAAKACDASSLEWSGLTGRALGRPATLLMRFAVIPAWALSFFVCLSEYSDAILGTAGHAWRLPASAWLAGAALLAMTAPTAAGGLRSAVHDSLFLSKVSFAVVTGLALAVASLVPETQARLEATLRTSGIPGTLPSTALLWMFPPVILLLADPGGSRPRPAALAASTALAVMLVSLAAILTMAGAATLSNGLMKVPEYLYFVTMRENTIGWVKGLAVWFTLLTAGRFSLLVLSRSAFRSPSLALCALTGAVALLIRPGLGWFVVWHGWAYPSTFFVSLSGVMAAIYLTGPASPAAGPVKAASTMGWLAGAAVMMVPPALTGDPPGTLPAPVYAGWLTAFLITFAARSLSRKRSSESSPPPAP